MNTWGRGGSEHVHVGEAGGENTWGRGGGEHIGEVCV